MKTTPINGITWLSISGDAKFFACESVKEQCPVSNARGCITVNDPDRDPVMDAWMAREAQLARAQADDPEANGHRVARLEDELSAKLLADQLQIPTFSQILERQGLAPRYG